MVDKAAGNHHNNRDNEQHFLTGGPSSSRPADQTRWPGVARLVQTTQLSPQENPTSQSLRASAEGQFNNITTTTTLPAPEEGTSTVVNFLQTQMTTLYRTTQLLQTAVRENEVNTTLSEQTRAALTQARDELLPESSAQALTSNDHETQLGEGNVGLVDLQQPNFLEKLGEIKTMLGVFLGSGLITFIAKALFPIIASSPVRLSTSIAALTMSFVMNCFPDDTPAQNITRLIGLCLIAMTLSSFL